MIITLFTKTFADLSDNQFFRQSQVFPRPITIRLTQAFNYRIHDRHLLTEIFPFTIHRSHEYTRFFLTQTFYYLKIFF